MIESLASPDQPINWYWTFAPPRSPDAAMATSRVREGIGCKSNLLSLEGLSYSPSANRMPAELGHPAARRASGGSGTHGALRNERRRHGSGRRLGQG